VGAPLIEEIGFRGIIYPALRDAIPRGWAIALTGILFGSLHGNLAALLPISVMGAWLCIIRDRFGLGTCILLHAMNNAWTIFWLVAAPEIATKL
jgi:membrane protease YdiL (CAAX protease family)